MSLVWRTSCAAWAACPAGRGAASPSAACAPRSQLRGARGCERERAGESEREERKRAALFRSRPRRQRIRTGAGEQRAERGGGAPSGSGRRSGSGRPAGNPSAPYPRAPARSSCERPRARSMGSGTHRRVGQERERNRREERGTERRRWGSARGVCAHHVNLGAEPRHFPGAKRPEAETSLWRPGFDGPAAAAPASRSINFDPHSPRPARPPAHSSKSRILRPLRG